MDFIYSKENSTSINYLKYSAVVLYFVFVYTGTVRVDIGYLTELNNESLFTNFTSASLEEFDKQRRIFTEELVDGKRITYVVRGVDCMEEYAEENVTVMIDLSPPVINNLWLTKGDVLNISVHSVVELHNLT